MDQDHLSKEEAERRAREVARQMLTTPKKPQKLQKRLDKSGPKRETAKQHQK